MNKEIKKILFANLTIILIVLSFILIVNKFGKFEDTSKTTADNPMEQVLYASKKVNCSDEGDNVGWTECMIETLDRIAAEREWKQRKIEALKGPDEVNTFNMISPIEDERLKIRKWREGFEKGRDSWCEAQMAFRDGSGIPGDIAQCEIGFELLAIKDLDSLYYDVILDFQSSSGISDFEPTSADIDKLAKANKTTRGCIWAGDEECS